MASTITADNGVVSGSAGIKSSADSSGVLALASGTGTTAVTIDTSQNVGIGTSSPTDGLLHLNGGATTNVKFTNSATGTTSGDGLFVGLASSTDTDGYFFNRESANIKFGTANTERMRIDSSGNVGIGINNPSKKLEVGSLGAFRLQTGSVTMDCTPTAGGTDGFVWNTSAASYYDWAYAGSVKMRIDSSGNLLVGTTTSPSNGTANKMISTPSLAVNNTGGVYNSSVLQVNGNGSNASATFYQGSTGGVAHLIFQTPNGFVGNISTSGSSTTYSTSSDYRLKEAIQPMTGALKRIAALKPVTYKWKVDGSDGEGFIAHELAEVVPDCVTGEKDAVDEDGNPVYQGIDTSFLVATLTAAIQEQQALIETLTQRITALENK